MLSSEDFISSPQRICEIVEWAITYSAHLSEQKKTGIQHITVHLHGITNIYEVVTQLAPITQIAPCTWHTAKGQILPYEIGEKIDPDSYSPHAPQVTIAVEVSGRQEIADTLEIIIRQGIEPEMLTEETFASHLRFLNCPDLVIKTRAVHLVDFMIWQTAYSELYFTKSPLSAFTQREFKKALFDYQSRKRKFGR